MSFEKETPWPTSIEPFLSNDPVNCVYMVTLSRKFSAFSSTPCADLITAYKEALKTAVFLYRTDRIFHKVVLDNDDNESIERLKVMFEKSILDKRIDDIDYEGVLSLFCQLTDLIQEKLYNDEVPQINIYPSILKLDLTASSFLNTELNLLNEEKNSEHNK